MTNNNDYIPPCMQCGGSCCKYVAIEIGKPTTKTEYDHIRWYLLHKDVNVFVDHDKKWFVEFRSPCENLTKQYRCTDYFKRPEICRDHGTSHGECEFYDTPYHLYFKSSYEFEKYLEKKGIDWQFKSHKQ